MSKVDPVTGTKVAPDYSVGSSPTGIAYDGTSIWVTNLTTDKVTKMNPSTGIIIDAFSTGDRPYGVAFDGTSIWVANEGVDYAGTVSKIDRVTGARTDYPTGVGSHGVAFDGTNIWVTNSNAPGTSGEHTVARVDRSTGAVVKFAVGRKPEGVVFDGANIWVTGLGDNTVTKLMP